MRHFSTDCGVSSAVPSFAPPYIGASRKSFDRLYRQSDIFPCLCSNAVNKFRAALRQAYFKQSAHLYALCAIKKSLYTSTTIAPTPRCSNQLRKPPSCALCAVKPTCNGVIGDVAFIHRREIGIRPGIVFIARRAIQYNVLPRGSSCGLLLSAGWRLPQRVTRMPLTRANGRSDTTLRMSPVRNGSRLNPRKARHGCSRIIMLIAVKGDR